MARMRDSKASGERYEIGIPEVGMPRNYINGGVIPDAFAGMGEGLQGIGRQGLQLGLTLMAKDEEYDRLKVADANSRYQKEMLNLLNAPETGWFNTRKQDAAAGIVIDFDAESQKVRDRIAGEMKMNKRQTGLFGVAVQQSAMPFYKSTQEFEQGEYNAYRDGTYKNGVESAIEIVMANPGDNVAMESTSSTVHNLIGTRFGNELPPEQLAQLELDTMSAIDHDRIAAVAVKDPFVAKAMLEQSPYLTNVHKQDLLKTLNGEIELAENQAVVSELVKKFGTNNPSAMAAYIRENYSGQREESLKQMSFERVSEMKATENLRKAEAAQAQSAAYQKLLNSDYPTTQADRQKMFDSGEINEHQLLVLNELSGRVFGRKSEAVSAIMKDPELKAEYVRATPDVKAQMEFTAMGIGTDSRVAVHAYLNQRAAAGMIDDDDLAMAKEYLTPGENQAWKQIYSNVKKNGTLLAGEADSVVKVIADAGSRMGVRLSQLDKAQDAVMNDFVVRAAQIPHDEKYVENMGKLKNEIISTQIAEFHEQRPKTSDATMLLVQSAQIAAARSLNTYQDIFSTEPDITPNPEVTPTVEITAPSVVSSDITVPVSADVAVPDPVERPVVLPVQPTIKQVENAWDRDIAKFGDMGITLKAGTSDSANGINTFYGRTSMGETIILDFNNGVRTLFINGKPYPMNVFLEGEARRKNNGDISTEELNKTIADVLGGVQ